VVAEAPVRFTQRVARYATVAAGSVFGLLGVAGLFADGDHSKPFAATLLAFGVWFAYRGFRSATVIVGRDRVVTRSLVRTRRYHPADLVGAHVEIGTTGGYGQQGQHLVLDLADGSTRRFRELSAKPPQSPGPVTVVDRAAAAVNAFARPPGQDPGGETVV
jgi:hypothetical protein